MRKNLLILLLFICLINSCNNYREELWELVSPSGELMIRIELNTDKPSGRLYYSVFFLEDEKEVIAIKKSPLGIINSKSDFTGGLAAVGSSISHIQNFNYQMITGKRKQNITSANCMEIEFLNSEKDTLIIKVMAFNDGIAFSYSIPGTGNIISIIDEITGFNIDPMGKAWIQPYDALSTNSPSYESGYINEMNIGLSSPIPSGWGFPALFKTNGLWILISEAGLNENYCGAHLSSECKNGEYKIKYPSEKESLGLGSSQPQMTTPLTTPWRFVLIGKTLAPIVESNIVYHLSEPSKIKDMSWINPGRSSWSWWSNHNSSMDFLALKSFIDLSSAMNWEYSLVDADWDLMSGGTLKNLVDYANTRKVGIILSYNSGGPHNDIPDGPRDLMFDPAIRRAEMNRISQMGVKGIKVNYFISDKQNIIKLYLDIAKDAAEYKLLLNTHGSTIPRGWTRTFPNYLSMEGVQGAESYSVTDFSKIALIQNTIYPFTRNVIGPMDYTPVIFTNYDEDHIHLTSNAHELALSIIFENGILHFADRVSSYYNLPVKVIDFIKTVPVTWDNTWLFDGYPGKFVVLGRENNEKYFIAGINGEDKIRETKLIPGFLNDSIYNARLITDAADQKVFDVIDFEYAKGDTMSINIFNNGGFVLTLSKK